MSELIFRVRAEYEEAIKCREELKKVDNELKNLTADASQDVIDNLVKKHMELTAKWENSMSSVGKTMTYIKEAISNVGSSIKEGSYEMRNFGKTQDEIISGMEKRLQIEDNIIDAIKQQRDLTESKGKLMETVHNKKVDEYENLKKSLDVKYNGAAEGFYSDADKEQLASLRKELEETGEEFYKYQTQMNTLNDMLDESIERQERYAKIINDTKDNIEELSDKTQIKLNFINENDIERMMQLRKLGVSFDISNISEQIISMTKYIRENEQEIVKSKQEIADWTNQLNEARDAGDWSTFNTLQKDIQDTIEKIETLEQNIGYTRVALAEMLDIGNGEKAPMLFDTQEAYDNVQRLKKEIDDLQNQIANFNGSNEGLEDLKDKLSSTEEELSQCELAAAKNAQELGAFGAVASEVSNQYYELTNKIKEQEASVGVLTITLEQAKQAYAFAKDSGNAEEIERTKTLVDGYTKSLEMAKNQVVILKEQQDGLSKKMRDTAREMNVAGEEIVGIFKNIAAVAGISFSLSQAKHFVDELVEIRSQMQDLESSLKIFLGSEQKAISYAEKLKNYSLTSLFHYNELMKVSQQMFGMGLSEDEAFDKMNRLANIAAATHASLSQVVGMYTRAYSMGSVMNRQLVTWNNLGLNVKDTLREMGESVGTSTVSFEKLDKVINKATDSGGKFANAQSEMMGNISAAIDSYKNQVELTFNQIGEKYQGVVTDAINVGTDLVKNYDKVGKVLMDIVAVYGSYRAALIAVAVAQKASAFWTNAETVATKINAAAKTGSVAPVTTATVARRLLTASLVENTKALMANTAACLTNPYVLLGAAVAGLTMLVYKLATAEDTEALARQRANEQIDKFHDKIDKTKNDIQSYINIIRDSNSTEYDKIVAWESLKKLAPSLTATYDMATIKTMEMDEATKNINKTINDIEFDSAIGEVKKWQKVLNKLYEHKDDGLVINIDSDEWEKIEKMLKDSGFERETFANKTMIEQSIEHVEALMRKYQNMVDGIEEARKKANTPIKIRIIEAEENANQKQDIYDFYDKAIALAMKVQNANNKIEYNEARDNFDSFILDVDKEIKNLDEKIKKNPLNPKFEVEKREKEKMKRELEAMRDQWKGIFSSPIPVTFQFSFQQAKKAVEDATSPGEAPEGKRWEKTSVGWMLVDDKKQEKVRNKEVIQKEKKAEQEAIDAMTPEQARADKKLKDGHFARLKKLNEELKAYTDTSKEDKKNQDRHAQAIADELSYQEKSKEITLKGRRALEDAKIAAIEDDGEREREQRRIQHERTLEDMKIQEDSIYKEIYERRKKEYERKHKDLKYENTKEGAAGWSASVMAGTLTKRETAYFNERKNEYVGGTNKEVVEYDHYLTERVRNEQKAVVELLKVWGDYEEKRWAITQEYAEKRRVANTEEEKAALTLEENKKLEELKTENEKEAIDWDGIFSSFEGHTKSYLEGLRKQLQGLLSSGDITDLTQLQTIQEKLRGINEEINKQGNMFSFASERQREHTRLVQEAADAEKRRQVAVQNEMSLSIENEAARNVLSMKGLKDVDLKQTNGEILKGLNPKSPEYKQMDDILNKLRVNEGKLAEARKKTAKATNEAKNAEDAAHESLDEAVARHLGNINEWAQTYLGDLPELMDKLGFGEAGKKVQAGLNGINDAAGAAADFASGNYVGAVLKGISAVENFGESLGLIAGSNREEIEKENAKLTVAIQINTAAINRLTEEMKKQNPDEAYKSYQMAVNAMKSNELAERQKMENNVRIHDGGHSLWSDFWDNGGGKIVKEIYGVLGKEYKDQGLGTMVHDLSAADYNYLLKNYPDLMKKLGVAIGNAEDEGNYNGMFQDILNFADEFSEKAYEKLKVAFQEAVTYLNFDSMYSSFVSKLTDMDSKASDFAKDLEGYLRNAVVQSFAVDNIKPLLESWYKGLAVAMKSKKNGNYLDEKEINELMNTGGEYYDEETGQKFTFLGYNQIVQKGLEERNVLKSLGISGSGSSQSSTFNSAQNITYEQGDSIAGSLINHSMLLENGNQNLNILNVTAESILGVNMEVRDTAGDVRDILAGMAIHVQDIRDDVRDIIAPAINNIDDTLTSVKRIVENQ